MGPLAIDVSVEFFQGTRNLLNDDVEVSVVSTMEDMLEALVLIGRKWLGTPR